MHDSLRHLTLCLLFLTSISSRAFTLKGRIVDTQDKSPLIGVNVLLTNTADTTQWKGCITDIDGTFRLDVPQTGTYLFNITYLSYKSINRTLELKDSTDLGDIRMTEESKLLKEVVIEDKQIRAQQLNDTTQYNVGSFKTNKDAAAEDLLAKMPGITSDNGTVKVNGDQVKKILVDGKEFFGDDPNIALKNLPAEIIDKVQVFDKLSDQAQLTGFDDGNSQKTINFITKKGRNNGSFGKIYGGYGGPGNTYMAGGNYNYFKGDRRLSVIGMSNNVNQQNFNAQDLLGISSGSGGGGFGGRGGYGGGRGRGGDNTLNNFLVGQQNGITTTHSIGINYSDVWGKKKKVKFTGSYFFNATKNNNNSELTRTYFSSSDSGTVYHELSNSVTKNFNHRLSMRVEYMIDSSNILYFTPKLSFQLNKSNGDVSGSSVENGTSLLSAANNQTTAQLHGYNFSNDVLYQHKFSRKGRTLSIDLNTGFNNKKGDGSLYSLNSLSGSDSITDQHSRQNSNSYTISGNIQYTEPIRKIGLLQFTYVPAYTRSVSDKSTYNYDTLSQSYSIADSSLSSNFDNTYLTNKAGAGFRYFKNKLNWMVSVYGQAAMLNSKETRPYTATVHKNFYSVLPFAMLNYKFSKEMNLRIFYRTSTSPPQVSQLQNVVDNTNPLQLSSGNPDLKQNYSHTLIANYGYANTAKATNLFLFFYGTYTHNYIGNSTFITDHDTTLDNGYTLTRGSQYTRPVNLDGYVNLRSFITYGLPVSKIKCNFNINGGFTYTRTPGQVNDALNISNNYALNAGMVLSSNISENIDFTVSYSANYNIVRNSLQSQSNSNYFNHTASAKFNWQFWKGFVFNTSVVNTLYRGIASYNSSYWLWNASLAYKFLKDQSLEVKFSAYDMLNQNSNISRNVTETYIEDSRTQALRRYFMGTITYTLRKFAGSADTPKEPKEFPGMMHPPGPGHNGPPPPGF